MRVRTRLTAAAGRKFGFTLGSAFVVLALVIFALRGLSVGVQILGIIGSVLLLAALTIPTRLGPVERVWMAFGHLISRVTSPIFLAILYFLVITPTGLLRRAFGHNALRRNPGDAGLAPGGTWVVRPPDKTRSDLSRQF